MSSRARTLTGFLLMCAAVQAPAQSPAPAPARAPSAGPTETPTRFEASFFGSFTRYDRAFLLKNSLGGGARIGYLITPNFEIEIEALLEAPQTPAASPSQVSPIFGGGSLILNLPTSNKLWLYGAAGYTRQDFGGSAPYRFSDGGPHGALGARIFLSQHVAIRAEGREIYVPSSNSTFGSSAFHFVASLGMSFFQAGTAVHLKDSDGDGVADKYDKCPNTPAGAVVDKVGCPIDSDKDGVPDGIDKCPNTPVGATVDAVGCPIDSDKDGVPDGIDKCPNTPVGATVDSVGCPSDSDGDGVVDGVDKCPNTPHGAVVDSVGCPVDSDHDGVPDGIDKCPNTPPGTKVDATGCPQLPAMDSDGDGVPDSLDKCPNTPRGMPVDAKGCPVLFQTVPAAPGAPPGAAPARPTYVLKGVNFQTGKSVLTPTSYATLDQVAAVLVANPDIKIEIAGYTDNSGSRVVNTRLSAARAFAVRAYLARKGVSPLRMIARGYGPA